MALRFITQARPEDLAAAQWALIAAVEETAGSFPVRYTTPTAAPVVSELLAGARAGANGEAGRWAILLGQYLPQLIAQLQAERDRARQETDGERTRVSLLEQRIQRLLADPLFAQVAALTAERDRLLERAQGLAERITELGQALAGQQRTYEARLTKQADEIADLRELVAKQQLKLNGLLVPEG